MHQVYLIQGVPVYTRALPSGGMAVWHPYNLETRAIIEPICRGCGYWQGAFSNWAIKRSRVAHVRNQLAARGRLVRTDLP